jgi:hypothetical protein
MFALALMSNSGKRNDLKSLLGRFDGVDLGALQFTAEVNVD